VRQRRNQRGTLGEIVELVEERMPAHAERHICGKVCWG
jgi:hypothetical protein